MAKPCCLRSSRRRVWPVAALCVCVLWGVTAPAGAAALFQDEAEQPPSAREEIPKKIKDKETWEYIINVPGRILYFPFWLLDKAVTPIFSMVGVYPQVSSKLARLLVSADGRRGILPTYESRTGGGLKFFLKDFSNPGSKFDAAARLGLRWRQYYSVRVQSMRIGGPFFADLSALYQYYPDEPFYGIGNDSPFNARSNFAQRTLSGKAALGVDLSSRLAMRVVAGYDGISISSGKNPAFPSTPGEFMFGTAGFPGLDERSDFVGLNVAFRLDSRNRWGNPNSGWEIDLSGGFMQDVSGSRFGFWKSNARAVRYIHMGFNRTLVLRLAGELTEPLGDREVPFYFLSELGRKETIRGFSRGRFRDKHAILGSLEYRYPIMKRDDASMNIDALYFVDMGRVSPDLFQEFSFRKYHVGFGGGFRLFSPNGRVLQFLVAKSRDEFRFYIMFY